MLTRHEAYLRHVRYYLSLAEEAELHLTGADQNLWLETLETAYENLCAALRWSLNNQTDIGLRLSSALWRFWEIRGYSSEGRQFLMQALESVDPQVYCPQRMRALTGAGNLAFSQNDYAAAHTLHEQSLTLARRHGSKLDVGTSLTNLGLVAWHQGNYIRAQTLFEEGLKIDRKFKNRVGECKSLLNLGLLAVEQSNYSTGRVYYKKALILSRKLGDLQSTARILNGLGNIYIGEGDQEGDTERKQQLYADAETKYQGV